MIKAVATFVLLGAAGTAGAQEQSVSPADSAEIAASVASCLAVTTAAGPDAEALAAQGWQKGTAMDPRGKPLATPFSVYGRKGGKTMIMIAPMSKGRGICAVTARIEGTDAAKGVVDALSTELKAKPAKVEQSDIYWFAGRKVVQLTSTGDRSKPSVRISVMQLPEKSK